MPASSIEPPLPPAKSKTPPISSEHHGIQTQHKRKRDLHDYFSPTTAPNPKTPRPKIATGNKTPTGQPTTPPGLTIHPNFITPAEESTLLAFLATQSWRTDLSRRVIHYGGTYCLMPPRTATPSQRLTIESTILTAPPLPPTFDFLINRMVSTGLYPPSAAPRYCIVNEYTGAAGISAHVENFRFGELVCALTLGDGDFMRFHELEGRDDGSVRSGKARVAPRTGRRVDVWMEGGSLLVMRGEARGRWQHEIVRGKKGREGGRGGGSAWMRTSLTFRTDRI